MLSSLASIADKTFIIAYVFPLILFALAIGGLFIDVSTVHALLEDISASDRFEKLTYLAIGLWVAALLLQTVNQIQLQIVEGYRWPVSGLPFLQRRQEARFDRANDPFQALDREWRAAIAAGVAFPADREALWDSSRTKLVTNFPLNKDHVLPTRFGNAVRAFETYSAEVYGADAIPLWLNLSMVMPKEISSSFDDARAQVSCLINIMFLAGLIALLALGRFAAGLLVGSAISGQPHWIELSVLFGNVSWLSIAEAASALLVAWGAYELAIEQAIGWGGLVKAAFDCYLPALAKSLGYDLPVTAAEQKAFWQAVSRRPIQHRALIAQAWPRAGAGGGGTP